MTGMGHNSGETDDTFVVSDEQLRGAGGETVSAEQLRLLIERIERLEEEKKGIADDIKDVYAEGKATGFDTKTMRTIIQLRKMPKEALDERDALVETYRNVLGM